MAVPYDVPYRMWWKYQNLKRRATGIKVKGERHLMAGMVENAVIAIKSPAWKIPDGIGRGRRTRTLNKSLENAMEVLVLVMLVPYCVPYAVL